MKNLITCLVVSVLSGATFADTWTVDDDGKADFNNIQAAVDAASDSSYEVLSESPMNGIHEHGHADVADTERLHLTNCVIPSEFLRFSTTPIHIPRGSVNVETIHDSGDPANRLDLVFVGDGYTAAEIPTYMNMVQDRANFILDYSPFDQYRNWINIHRVDVISAESGVDNDPDNGNVDVDTAMDMYITGSQSGGDYLLMDWSLGYAYANLAPDVDSIVAAGNTTWWCGAGTGFGIATFTGHNWNSVNLMLHEMAHSLMYLADEYYTEGDVYTGGERSERNVSIMNAGEMSAAMTKWAHWLGYSLPDIGVHDTYEGARYCEYGIYRPSQSSLMGGIGPSISLNGPGVEATILQLHLAVDPIESISYTDLFVDADAILSADILHPIGHQLEITWRVNGDVVATGSSTLDLGSITLPAGANLVQLTVVDPNPLVHDERLRADFLTSRRAWVAYTGTAPNGACCLGESCFVASEAECAANSGYWVDGEDCNGIGCYWFDSCMLVDSFAAGINTDLPPDLDIVGVSIRRLPGNLIEARIELLGPPLPPDDPNIGNRVYRILVDTDAPFMTTADWDDVDQEWSVQPIGGSYRGASQMAEVLDVEIDGNTIIMLVDPNVLRTATEISFFAQAGVWDSSVWNTEVIGQGIVPRWEDLDDDGIPDHCEVAGTTRDVCPAGCTYTTIQQAIDAASDGDEILVGPGTYTSTSDNVVNTLGKNVWLHSSHGPEQTIIDGQGLRRGILTNSGESSQMVIEGFTVQNGYADSGAGMFCAWSNATLKNCVFRNNVAVNWGGGFVNNGSFDTTLTDCTFEGNMAFYDGGGLWNGWEGSPQLLRCSFISNTATGNGGGIQNWDGGTSQYIECTFIGNIATNGGGVFSNSSTSSMFDCTFDGNEAELGGGIYSEGGTLSIDSCVFTDHAAGSGGGLYSYGTSVTVTGSDFLGNSVYWDGGGIVGAWGDMVVNACRFDNNEAYWGGGIRIHGTSTQITDCRISENIAGETGGGLHISETVVNITDTMFCANLPNHVAGEITGSGIEFLDLCPADCDGDINGDGYVNVSDLLIIINQWGLTDSPADLNEDGIVNVSDMLIVIGNWGPCE